MHVPDGFLDARTCAGSFCLAGAGLTWAARRVSAGSSQRGVPLMGVMSAFIFAGQMVNFPISAATSGHLLGAALATMFLGPWAASLALATVVTVQCLFFQDGGLTALGANLLSMAVVGPWAAYAAQRLFARWAPQARPAALISSAWISIVASSFCCSCLLAATGVAAPRVLFTTMLLTHAVIGVGEAMITVAVGGFVLRVRPDLCYQPEKRTLPTQPLGQAFGLAAAALIGAALLLAPWASSLPDGLESVAQRLRFAPRAHETLSAPAAGYAIPGVKNESLSTILAGGLGVLLCLGAGASWWTRWRQRSKSSGAPFNS